MDGTATLAEIQTDYIIEIIIFSGKGNSLVYPGHEIKALVSQKANELR